MRASIHGKPDYSLFCLCLQEKEQALKMWQAAAQELDRLQNEYQSTVSDGQMHAVEWQHMQVTNTSVIFFLVSLFVLMSLLTTTFFIAFL